MHIHTRFFHIDTQNDVFLKCISFQTGNHLLISNIHKNTTWIKNTIQLNSEICLETKNKKKSVFHILSLPTLPVSPKKKNRQVPFCFFLDVRQSTQLRRGANPSWMLGSRFVGPTMVMYRTFIEAQNGWNRRCVVSFSFCWRFQVTCSFSQGVEKWCNMSTENSHVPWKMVVGRLISFWNRPCLSGHVGFPVATNVLASISSDFHHFELFALNHHSPFGDYYEIWGVKKIFSTVISCFSDIWRLLRIYTIPVIRFELRKQWNFSLWQVKMGEGFTCFQPVFEKDASHRFDRFKKGTPGPL